MKTLQHLSAFRLDVMLDEWLQNLEEARRLAVTLSCHFPYSISFGSGRGFINLVRRVFCSCVRAGSLPEAEAEEIRELVGRFC